LKRLVTTAVILARDESGQAMAEYAIVVAGITGVLVGATFTLLPDFINALQRYYDSFYIMISLPIP
jgi:Flp pilus assembly pilin Flp